MKAISSADKANVISLLLSGHSIRKVESITGLGKWTVCRIYQELEMDKENYKGGRLSKLSPREDCVRNLCVLSHYVFRLSLSRLFYNWSRPPRTLRATSYHSIQLFTWYLYHLHWLSIYCSILGPTLGHNLTLHAQYPWLLCSIL